MKKIMIIIALLFCVVGFSGCDNGGDPLSPNNPFIGEWYEVGPNINSSENLFVKFIFTKTNVTAYLQAKDTCWGMREDLKLNGTYNLYDNVTYKIFGEDSISIDGFGNAIRSTTIDSNGIKHTSSSNAYHFFNQFYFSNDTLHLSAYSPNDPFLSIGNSINLVRKKLYEN